MDDKHIDNAQGVIDPGGGDQSKLTVSHWLLWFNKWGPLVGYIAIGITVLFGVIGSCYTVNSRIESLSTGLGSRVDGVGTRVDGVSTRIDSVAISVDQRIGRIESQVVNLHTKSPKSIRRWAN